MTFSANRALAAAALMGLVAACGPASDDGTDALAVGAMAAFEHADSARTLPDLELAALDGRQAPLSADLADVTLVNLWATWCAPCVVEMPALNALQKSYDPDRFRIITVSLDQNAGAAAEFFTVNQLDALTFRHDPSFESASAFGAPGLPVSVLYDGQGREIGRVEGPAEWDTDEARALIDAALSDA